MKKWVVGSLVGAIIVFCWQFLSWSVLGVHSSTMKYTPGQNEILNTISANIQEEGLYMLPSAPTEKEMRAMEDSLEGKPWATVIYHKQFKMDMVKRMVRGFLVDFFLVLTLIYILTRGGTPTGMRIFAGSVALGLAYFLWGPYTGRIWFDLPWSMITGDFIDSVAAWGLTGIWLAWWLNRKRAAA